VRFGLSTPQTDRHLQLTAVAQSGMKWAPALNTYAPNAKSGRIKEDEDERRESRLDEQR
jgi:hypothetical protein